MTNRYDLVSQSQQRAVFESLLGSSPVAFVYIDIKGNVVTCNPAFESLFGYSLSEMTGNNIDIFITNKETLEEARELTTRAGESEVLRMRSTRYHRNGSRVDVESQGMPVFVNGKAVGIIAQYHDVTHLKNAERIASDLYSSFKLLMDSIDTDVYVSDMDTYDILFMNKHMEDSFGSGLIGKKCYAEYRQLPGPCPHCTNNQLVNADGSPSAGVIWEGKNPVTGRWYKNSDRAVYWNDNRLVRLQIATDITDIKEAEKKMEHLATHDPLTGLPNRALFQDRLDHALKTYKRDQSIFAVMFLDLDKFKQINDTLGHLAGDQVLQETAKRLLSCIRESDTIARVSGDEFTFIIEHIETPGDFELVSNRILESLSSPYTIDGNVVNISCSIGISFFPEHGSDIDSLINNADFAMYKAKSTGGNCTIIYSSGKEKDV